MDVKTFCIEIYAAFKGLYDFFGNKSSRETLKASDFLGNIYYLSSLKLFILLLIYLLDILNCYI